MKCLLLGLKTTKWVCIFIWNSDAFPVYKGYASQILCIWFRTSQAKQFVMFMGRDSGLSLNASGVLSNQPLGMSREMECFLGKKKYFQHGLQTQSLWCLTGILLDSHDHLPCPGCLNTKHITANNILGNINSGEWRGGWSNMG